MWYFEKDEDGYWIVSNGLQAFQLFTRLQAANLSALLNDKYFVDQAKNSH